MAIILNKFHRSLGSRQGGLNNINCQQLTTCMNLYTTTLVIDNFPVRYNVSWQQGHQFLLFKPELPLAEMNDYPIFWVTKQNGVWTPINVQDSSLVTQVVEDISRNLVE